MKTVKFIKKALQWLAPILVAGLLSGCGEENPVAVKSVDSAPADTLEASAKTALNFNRYNNTIRPTYNFYPGRPQLVNPANNHLINVTSGIPTRIFTWHQPTSGPTPGYYLLNMVDADDPNGFKATPVVINRAGPTTSTLQIIPPAFAGKRVRWSVSACRGTANSTFRLCGSSASRILTWNATPLAPRLFRPLSGATVEPTGQVYTWSSSRGASSYLFCASKPGVACPKTETDNANTLVLRRIGYSNTATAPDLSRFLNQTVNWTAAACNSSGDCTYQQSVRPVTIQLPPPLPPPNLWTPATSATVTPTGGNFSWTSVSGAVDYLFCASKPGFACPQQPIDNANTLVLRLNGTSVNPDLTRFFTQTVNWTAAACDGHGRCTYQQNVRPVTINNPPPFIKLALSDNNVEVVWGNSASLTVSVEGHNNFSGPVDLSLTNAPIGVAASFSPPTIIVPANGTASSTLTLSTVQGATDLKPPALRVRAQPQANASAKTKNFNLTVLRVSGQFVSINLRTTTLGSPCNGITAVVVPTGNGVGVQFDGPLFSRRRAVDFAPNQGYAIGPDCRTGVVLGPVSGSNQRITLWNLGFERAVGGSKSPGSQIDNPLGPYLKGFFSPDGSLFLLVVATPNASTAKLYDTALGKEIGPMKTGLISNITGAELVGDTVTIDSTPAISYPSWMVR